MINHSHWQADPFPFSSTLPSSYTDFGHTDVLLHPSIFNLIAPRRVESAPLKSLNTFSSRSVDAGGGWASPGWSLWQQTCGSAERTNQDKLRQWSPGIRRLLENQNPSKKREMKVCSENTQKADVSAKRKSLTRTSDPRWLKWCSVGIGCWFGGLCVCSVSFCS